MSEEEKLPERIKIKVLETQGMSSLIEWHIKGIPFRGYLENERIDGDKCAFSALTFVFPVGPDPFSLDVRKLTKALRKRDVWTLADYRQKPNSVIKSLLEAMEV